MKFKKIAILGGGNLGSSIAKGLLSVNAIAAEDLTVTRRRLHLIEDLKQLGVIITSDNVAAIKDKELIIIAVKPHQIMGLLSEVATYIDPKNQIVISAVTGIAISQLETIVPNVPVYRAMPNTAIAINESMTCIAGNGKYKQHEEDVKNVFEPLGTTIIISEELMGAATVIGACGIAFALRFMRAMSQGGIEIGFSADISQLITAQTIKGAAQLILESGNHPEKEIDKVTTPMGVTISGLNEMEHQGFSSSVIKGLITSYNKLDLVKSKK